MTPGRLPDLLIIGAMKAGTTSLHRYLSTHPQVFMSSPKELNFFVEELNWQRGLDWYAGNFAEAGDAKVAGESSPHYTKYPNFNGVPARIAAVIPDVRLVYLVRDPIERMRSQFEFRAAKGLEKAPIDEALLTRPNYLDASRYATQIERYLEHFESTQLHVAVSERLKADPSSELVRIHTFLGVEPRPVEKTIGAMRTGERQVLRPAARFARSLPGARRAARLAPSGVSRLLTRRAPQIPTEISPPVRAELEAELAAEVDRLRNYLGPDFDGWGLL